MEGVGAVEVHANELVLTGVQERHSLLKQLGCAYGYLKVCPLDKLVSLQLVSCTHELAAICALRGVLSWKVRTLVASNDSARAD